MKIVRTSAAISKRDKNCWRCRADSCPFGVWLHQYTNTYRASVSNYLSITDKATGSYTVVDVLIDVVAKPLNFCAGGCHAPSTGGTAGNPCSTSSQCFSSKGSSSPNQLCHWYDGDLKDRNTSSFTREDIRLGSCQEDDPKRTPTLKKELIILKYRGR